MNSEFTIAVHCLLYLSHLKCKQANSEQIAASVSTHPARVRKVLAVLRKEHYVTTKEGAGGGYQLNLPLQEITLGDLYRIFARGALRSGWCSGSEDSACRISSKIQPAMEVILIGGEERLESYFSGIRLSEVQRLIDGKEPLFQGGIAMNNINRDDKLLFYVGSYAEESSDGIHLCELDNNTGELQVLHGTSGIKNPSFLVVNQDHTRLYAVSEQSEGAVFSYEIDQGNGTLTQLAQISTEGADPCHLSLDGIGSLYAANYSSGHVNRYVLDERGAAAEPAAIVQHMGQGFREDRQEAAHAHSIVSDAEGRYAYVCDLGLDQIIYYDLQEGKLTTAGEVELPPGAGPRHFLIHPNERHAYAINELNSTITVFAYNRIQGHLEILQHVPTVPGDFGGENYPADLHLSPDGRYVYGSNRGHDSIVKLTVNLETGMLDAPEWTCGKINWPRNFAVLERFVLIANQNGDDIAVFRRDPATGELTATEHRLALKQPVCIEPL